MIRVLFICHGISIHALFAEGDHFVIFNHSLIIEISIHALFAEGDPGITDTMIPGWNFYPRPLRRGRQ